MPLRREEWQGRNKGSAYIRWYSGDILSDGFVAGLTPTEENCYRRLLDFNARDGFIPHDPDRLATMCKLTQAEFEPIWSAINEKFPAIKNCAKKRCNTRIKFELLHQKNRSVSAFERGRKGGRPVKRNKTKELRDNLQVSCSLAKGKAKGKLKKPIQIQIQTQDKKKEIRGSVEPPAWHAGITWNKAGNKVDVSEESWRELTGELKDIACKEGLSLLVWEEYALSIGRLNGHLIGNPHKRGKALPALFANWLATDMRTKAQRSRGKSNSPAAEELATEQAWEAQRPDNTAAIAACEEKHGPHDGRLTKRKLYSFCGKSCGYREDP